MIKKKDAKKWVYDKFEGSDLVNWINRPKGKKEKVTISDILKEWKSL